MAYKRYNSALAFRFSMVLVSAIALGFFVGAGDKNELVKVVVHFAQKTIDTTEIKVIDNGPGIDKEIQDQIFVPFFSTKDGGSGVGLSHSRQIVRAHGGGVKCISTNGRTEFVIEV